MRQKDDSTREIGPIPEDPPTPPPPPLAPVALVDRVNSVDVMRGVALLGILIMNIYAFSMPMSAYSNPFTFGGSTGINLGVWIFTHIFVEQKFMTTFSMLFGAGLVLMWQRAQARGRKFGAIYYRRTLWLIVFGMIHGYLIWGGDILFHYGLSGLVLYLFRKRSARTLIIVGMVGLLITVGLSIGLGKVVGFMRDTAAEAEVALAAGESLTELQDGMRENWNGMQAFFAPTAEDIAREVSVYRGGYIGILIERAPQTFMMHTFMTILMIFWQVTGIMLIGMGLMKSGVFSAERTVGFYVKCVILGYAIGLPLVAFGTLDLFRNGFDAVRMLSVSSHFNNVGCVVVALGHVGVVMLVIKSGALSALRTRLAAVGRMALSNYLSHSAIFTLIFYGYGLGFFGHFERLPQMGFVVAVWILQLVISPIWLSRFRFGPAEWLWRSLTYWKRQPMRIRPVGE